MRNIYERTMIEGIERTSDLVAAGASHNEIEMSLIAALDAIVAYYVYRLADSGLSEREKIRRLKNMVGRAVQKIHAYPCLWIATFTDRVGYHHPEAGWTALFNLAHHLQSCFLLLPEWLIGNDRQAVLDLFGPR